MNCKDLKKLTQIRRKEARLLLKNRNYEGAYYLSGYIVECALKVCIAKQTKKCDFPDIKTVNASYTHNLTKLVKTGGLLPALNMEISRDPDFEINWTIVKDWSEKSRYEKHTKNEANGLYSAITNPEHGVLKWIRQHW
jgi:HEPN domain-containing protein